MNDFDLNLLCTIRNVITLILFTYLAVAFGKWWIVLFAAFFMVSIETKVIKKKGDKDDE